MKNQQRVQNYNSPDNRISVVLKQEGREEKAEAHRLVLNKCGVNSCSFLLVVLAVVASAAVSNSATLTVTPDKMTYSPGETINLRVQGTINPTAELASHIDVRLDFANATFVSSRADQALNPPPMFGSQTGWTVGGTQGDLLGNSLTVFGQIQGLPPGGVFVNNFNGVNSSYITADVVATAGSPGTATFNFGSLTNFFGVGAGSGTSVSIIPEPSTATLLALGLAGCILTRRRSQTNS